MEDTIKALTRENEDLKDKLSDFNIKYKEMEQKYKILLEVQTRYTEANDNEIRRVNDKIVVQENSLQEIQMKFYECMKMEAELGSLHSNEDRYTDRDMDELRSIKRLSLAESVDQFVLKFKHLVQIHKQYENLLDDKNTILNHMGYQNNRQVDEAVGFNSRREISSTDGNYQSKMCALGCTMWQNVIMKVMKKQLNDLRVSARKKDSHILTLNQDLAKLRQRIAELEKQLQDCIQNKYQSKPNSAKERLYGNISSALSSGIEMNSLEMSNSFSRNSKNGIVTPPTLSQQPLVKPTAGVQPHRLVSDIKPHVINYPLGVATQVKPWIQTSKPNNGS